MDRYDVIAIGAGSAGLVTAAGAAGLGARVALVEQHRLGGECLWTGCVPSKALLAAARAAAQVRRAQRYGVRVAPPEIDFAAVMAWVRQAQDRIAPHDSPSRFRGLGVDVVEGVARFVGERDLDVNGRILHGKHIVIATGSRPAIPDLPGLDQIPYHTNETIFTIAAQPSHLIVLGAGPIGLELAQAFARLGSRVTVIEAADRLLPREDRELADLLAASIRADGVELLLGDKAVRAARAARGVHLTLAGGRTVHGDALLIATGRRPNYEMLELARAKVAVAANGIRVDQRLRTTTRGVWAAGDITGAPRFTHVADYQARLVLRNALFPLSTKASYANVPWVTFTDPELAHVGLTEDEARARHGDDIRIWRRSFDDLDRAVADGERTGLVKLIADARGRLLGGHVLGYLASSLIGEIALALEHRIGIASIASTIHAYPTYPEAIKQAAEGHTRARLVGRTRQIVRWWVRR